VASRARLVGTRLALAGTLLYFLEWAAIAFIPETGDPALLGEDPARVVELYRGEAGAIGFAAAWFGLVLLGRILFVAALRRSLRDSGRDSLLVDFAVGAMIVSVAVEVASFGPAAAAGWLADAGGDPSAIVALDAAGGVMFLLVFVPIATSVVAAAAGMLWSGLFPRWLCWLGIAAGALAVVGGIIQVAFLRGESTLADVGQPLTGVGALGFWIWMLATSIILWRAAPARTRTADAAA
jgi:hypothetical protein